MKFAKTYTNQIFIVANLFCYSQGVPITSTTTGSNQTGAKECGQVSDAQRLALVEAIH